ncbi:MAG: hypothetical protein ABIH23_34865 [bacterium]
MLKSKIQERRVSWTTQRTWPAKKRMNVRALCSLSCDKTSVVHEAHAYRGDSAARDAIRERTQNVQRVKDKCDQAPHTTLFNIKYAWTARKFRC